MVPLRKLIAQVDCWQNEILRLVTLSDRLRAG